MKTRNLITFAAATLLLSSCIPSVNPFYTAKDLVFDPALLGEWQTKESSSEEQSFWKFEKGDENAYQLTIVEKDGKEGRFKAHLFKLKEDHFLDLVPSDCDYATNQTDLVAYSMFPGHLLVRLSRLEPELKLAFFDFDWLKAFLEKNPKALAHHTEGKSIVLTASTRDLQRFILKHLKQGKLFENPETFSRKED